MRNPTVNDGFIHNPFDNVGMPAKVLSLNERRSYKTLQRKRLNVKTLRGDETDRAGKPSSFAGRHVELETVLAMSRDAFEDLFTYR
jgi:hypothetical protein